MGKRIIQQARGHGSLTYRVRRAAYKFRIGYPNAEGKGLVVKLVTESGHSAPLAKIDLNGVIFYNPAFKNMFEGQEIQVGGSEIKEGNVVAIGNLPIGTKIYNIETKPGNGGKLIRTSGSSAVISKKTERTTGILMPSKKEIILDSRCRATIGIIAGHGRLDKPVLKAGRMFYLMKARNKLWPRTSALKHNVVDHPFGSGRGKRLAHGQKGKIPKTNAPPGAYVGSLHPRRTGRRK